MSSDCIIGPYFFEENVNSQNYLKMLKEFFWPQIQNIRRCKKFYFQQDGAPSHFGLNVRNWLDSKPPGRWIGRGGPIEWPARSPDLTPLDFYLWGYLKQKVYQKNHATISELCDSIRSNIQSIKPDVLKGVFLSIPKRLEKVIKVNGRHIEGVI